MAHLCKKVFACVVGAATLIMVGLVAYHTISPKMLVSNYSGHATSEVTFNFPDNRITFAHCNLGAPPLSSSTNSGKTASVHTNCG